MFRRLGFGFKVEGFGVKPGITFWKFGMLAGECALQFFMFITYPYLW